MALFKGPAYLIGDFVGLWVALFSIVAIGGKHGHKDERARKRAHKTR